jgi:threonine dehydratase
MARYLGLPCRVIVPDNAPATKLEAIERLGAETVKVSYDRWWRVLMEHQYEGMKGLFVHPVADPAVIAGNGTIGLEILDDLPEVDTVVVPFGGGGLSSGIASAIRARRPATKVWGAEVETSTPLTAAFAAGRAVSVERTPSFVDGIGGKGVLDEMWPLVHSVLAGALVASLRQIADAIRLMVERNRVVAEGAGGASVAAALAGKAGNGKIVCVVSGGNLDTAKLATILAGRIP